MVVPCPTPGLVATRRPWCAATIARAMVSPRPLPWLSLVALETSARWNRLKTASSWSGEMPSPSSPTIRYAWMPTARTVRVTCPSVEVCRNALSSRLAKTWARRWGSPRIAGPVAGPW